MQVFEKVSHSYNCLLLYLSKRLTQNILLMLMTVNKEENKTLYQEMLHSNKIIFLQKRLMSLSSAIIAIIPTA